MLLALLDAPEIFEVGSHGREWEAFANAAKAAMPALTDEQRGQVEAAVLSLRPELDFLHRVVARAREGGEVRRDDLARTVLWNLPLVGEVERAILSTIGSDRLSDKGRRRLGELDRKFADKPLPEPRGMMAGWVQSPIDSEATGRMSDAQWLAAMERYSDNERDRRERNGIYGGARELATHLQAQTKANPARFAALMQAFPSSTHPTYVDAVLHGLREAQGAGGFAAAAIETSARWPEANFARSICWLVERHSEAASTRSVVERLLVFAVTGTASDSAVRTMNRDKAEPTSVMEILHTGSDLEASGINEERGSAFKALASVLWDDASTLGEIADLVARRIDEEELPSVRVCMLRTINSIARHDVGRGILLLQRLAGRDIVCLQSQPGRLLLDWLAYAYPVELGEVVRKLSSSEAVNLRVLGLFIEAGVALADGASTPGFVAGFEGDVLKRQVAVFRAAGNIRTGAIGDRAAEWLLALFDDPERRVRDETANVRWEQVLDPSVNRHDIARAYIASKGFEEHSDRIFRALEERLDSCTELTFLAMKRLLALFDIWKARGEVNRSAMTSRLGRILVALYRAVQGDTRLECELLDLFDVYLRQDIWDLRSEIAAYERH